MPEWEQLEEGHKFFNPVTGLWTKRDTQTGRFMNVKTSDNTPFKGVRKEK